MDTKPIKGIDDENMDRKPVKEAEDGGNGLRVAIFMVVLQNLKATL